MKCDKILSDFMKSNYIVFDLQVKNMNPQNNDFFDLPPESWELQKEVEANQPVNHIDIAISKIVAQIWETQIYFTPYQATSIILDLDPYETRNESRNKAFRALKEVLEQYTAERIFLYSKMETIIDKDLGDITIFKIHRNDILIYRNEYLKIPLTLKEVAKLDYSSIKLSRSNEYEADIPIKTDKDKLSHFIKLLIKASIFSTNSKIPTYSELHTKLSAIYKNEKIPSKNTIKKYLEA